MKPVLLTLICRSCIWRCIYTLFNAAQSDLTSYKWSFFDILNIKHWILIFTIIKKMKIDFKCEINHVTINKWVVATEPNHLNDWIIQERITETEPSHLNDSLNHSGTNHWDWTKSFKRLIHSGTNHFDWTESFKRLNHSGTNHWDSKHRCSGLE